ncbi:hypothetical protein DN30_3636 [Vibrio cholerae]|nr:hypothetical protein DN30_3636 [Vibrio cholerae]
MYGRDPSLDNLGRAVRAREVGDVNLTAIQITLGKQNRILFRVQRFQILHITVIGAGTVRDTVWVAIEANGDNPVLFGDHSAYLRGRIFTPRAN